jgi:hypothetical protein
MHKKRRFRKQKILWDLVHPVLLMTGSDRRPHKIAWRRCCENAVELKCLGSTLTDWNFFHETINSRLNSENACYHSVRKLVSSRLSSENAKIKMYRIIISPVVWYESETQGKNIVRVLENRVLRNLFVLKRDEIRGGLIKLHNEKCYDGHFSPNTELSNRRW